jgi:hypothetical protein
VAMGGGFDYDEIDPLISPALVEVDRPLPADPDGIAKLNAALETIAAAPEPKPATSLPEMAGKISGKPFVYDPNALQLKTSRLDSTTPRRPASLSL